ncbi:MAG TPA: ABC transporter ATP-binding protein [Candidatus Sulfotelmatobacter sp.]|nr:ABC transporter ATP-binding protein [Candidatus Sulfotelmatobacter sp.]
MLQIQVKKQLGSFALDVELATADRGVLVLVGESGSGKSTLLRLIAGIFAPDSGKIVLEGAVLDDTAESAHVPAEARRVGYVPQDYALFPHLTARENVAFGLRARGVAGDELGERTRAALQRMGLAELAGHHPAQLSGGQQQRVALARALVLEPALLLLDEPLAALDLKSRRSIRAELRRLLDELPCVSLFVTHSPAEALAFGEQIAVLESGRITQLGRRDELMHRPRSRYIAEFLGTNLFRARVRAVGEGSVAILAVENGEIAAAPTELEGEVFAVVDPREITISLELPEGSAQNVLPGRVEDLQPEPPGGERIRVSLASRPPLVADLTRAAVDRLRLAPGREVYASFKATGVRVFM